MNTKNENQRYTIEISTSAGEKKAEEAGHILCSKSGLYVFYGNVNVNWRTGRYGETMTYKVVFNGAAQDFEAKMHELFDETCRVRKTSKSIFYLYPNKQSPAP